MWEQQVCRCHLYYTILFIIWLCTLSITMWVYHWKRQVVSDIRRRVLNVILHLAIWIHYFSFYQWYVLILTVLLLEFVNILESKLQVATYNISLSCYVVKMPYVLILNSNWKKNRESMFEVQSGKSRQAIEKYRSQQKEHMQQGRDQVSGGVRVACLHVTSVANNLWKHLAFR